MGVLADAVRSQPWQGPFGMGDRILKEILGGGTPTLAGVAVNEDNALTISPIWAAVRVISEDVASLPLHLHKRLSGGGKERFTSHRLYKIIHDEPNPEMSSMTFREMLQAHALTWGTGYAEIVRDASGQLAELWPLHPSRVQWDRDRGGRLIYHVANADGTRTTLARADMFRLPGLSDNGVTGYSPIRLGLQSHGLTKATEAFGATFFGNGARPGGVLEHPSRLSDKLKGELRDNVQAIHGGVRNANRIAILEEGMTYHAISVPPEDAQFLGTREFQVIEVARWFNISPTKLRDLSRATFSNVEHEAIAHVVHTLRPWLCRWEQEIQRSLVAPLERTQQFAEHLVDGLLRGDIGSRYNAYAIAREKGWLSADDIREFENMNPLPNGQGKVYLIPSNMVPAGRIDEVIDAQVKPKPAPVAAPAPAAKSDDEAKAERDAFLLHIVPKLDDLARRVAGLEIPTPDAIAEVLQHSLAATDAAVETVSEMLRTQGEGASAAMTEALGKVDALTERVSEAELSVTAKISATSEWVGAHVVEGVTGHVDAKLLEHDARTAEASEIVTQSLTELVVAQTELRERLDASESACRAKAERLANVVPGLRDVIVAAVRKEVRFEGDRARKAATTPEKLRWWMESFYATREDACVQMLLPTMRLRFIIVGRPEEAEAETRRLVAAWLTDSRDALTRTLESETLASDVEALVMRWEAERPAAIADELLREVIRRDV